MKVDLFIPMAFALMLCSCRNDDTASQQVNRDLGKYIYQGDDGVYHSDPSCHHLIFGKDEDEHRIYAKHPVDTAKFVIEDEQYFRVCGRCVGDEQYEHFRRLSERNSRHYYR